MDGLDRPDPTRRGTGHGEPPAGPVIGDLDLAPVRGAEERVSPLAPEPSAPALHPPAELPGRALPAVERPREPAAVVSPLNFREEVVKTQVYDATSFSPRDRSSIPFHDSGIFQAAPTGRAAVLPAGTGIACCDCCVATGPGGGGGVFLADAPVVPAPAPAPGEPCKPEEKAEIRFIVFVLDESEYPKTKDPNDLQGFWPKSPEPKEGEKVDYKGPKVVDSGKDEGISYLLVLFTITITKKRTCADGSTVEDKLTLFIFILFVWLPKDKDPSVRGRWAKELLDLLKQFSDLSGLQAKAGSGADSATMRWQDNAFVYVGHDTGSNSIPWQDIALTGLFSGELQPGVWGSRMVDMSCFGEAQGRLSQDYAFHSDKDKDSYMPPDTETLGFFALGDVNGGQRHWNNRRPKTVVVPRRGRLPSSRFNPPRRTTPPPPRPK